MSRGSVVALCPPLTRRVALGVAHRVRVVAHRDDPAGRSGERELQRDGRAVDGDAIRAHSNGLEDAVHREPEAQHGASAVGTSSAPKVSLSVVPFTAADSTTCATAFVSPGLEGDRRRHRVRELPARLRTHCARRPAASLSRSASDCGHTVMIHRWFCPCRRAPGPPSIRYQTRTPRQNAPSCPRARPQPHPTTAPDVPHPALHPRCRDAPLPSPEVDVAPRASLDRTAVSAVKRIAALTTGPAPDASTAASAAGTSAYGSDSTNTARNPWINCGLCQDAPGTPTITPTRDRCPRLAAVVTRGACGRGGHARTECPPLRTPAPKPNNSARLKRSSSAHEQAIKATPNGRKPLPHVTVDVPQRTQAGAVRLPEGRGPVRNLARTVGGRLPLDQSHLDGPPASTSTGYTWLSRTCPRSTSCPAPTRPGRDGRSPTSPTARPQADPADLHRDRADAFHGRPRQ